MTVGPTGQQQDLASGTQGAERGIQQPGTQLWAHRHLAHTPYTERCDSVIARHARPHTLDVAAMVQTWETCRTRHTPPTLWQRLVRWIRG